MIAWDQLYQHQQESIEGLRTGLRNGHRSQVLMAPTGAGKTVMATFLMQEVQAKSKRVAFIVDRVALVDQTSETLDFYGLDHGVIQAGHWRRREYERIQVCSAQTIEKRGFFPDLDLLIVDECHATRKATSALIKARPGMRVIGLTATPFTKGMASLYSNLVSVCTTNELIAKGELVPLVQYAAKAIEREGVKKVGGEFVPGDAASRGMTIVGDVVSEWVSKTRKHFGGPVKTIVFSADVAHGEELCRQFNAAGFNFQQVSYKDGDDESRRALIREFKKPDSQITGLVSCEVFTKGFDVTDILCGISARPYSKSLSSHVQQLGRVMRKSPGKTFGLWLDHSGNLMHFRREVEELFEHGLSGLEGGDLDSRPRKEATAKEKVEWRCGCGYVFQAYASVCPACGKERVKHTGVETVAGSMEEVTHAKPQEPAYLADRDSVWSQLCQFGLERKKGDEKKANGFAYMNYQALYGVKPNRKFTPGTPITDEVKRKVMHHIIRWAKAQRGGANAVR